MAQSRFSLSWNEHQKNICSGLSILQQSEQFVDMTLAADGHLVKVHQVIIALASPYIKELIASAQCPHPVIFLNKVSYATLCAILEYIYTGEVLVSVDQLNDLVLAAKELHIAGLKDMSFSNSRLCTSNLNNSTVDKDEEAAEERINIYEAEQSSDQIIKYEMPQASEEYGDKDMSVYTDTVDEPFEDTIQVTEIIADDMAHVQSPPEIFGSDPSNILLMRDDDKQPTTNFMQYTVSNRGSLQMILNRFIYYLKHSNRNNTRQWRCVDYVSGVKCPAYVVTKGDVVTHRISMHTHTFHDKRILKKVKAGAIFSAIREAEEEGQVKKSSSSPVTVKPAE